MDFITVQCTIYVVSRYYLIAEASADRWNTKHNNGETKDLHFKIFSISSQIFEQIKCLPDNIKLLLIFQVNNYMKGTEKAWGKKWAVPSTNPQGSQTRKAVYQRLSRFRLI